MLQFPTETRIFISDYLYNIVSTTLTNVHVLLPHKWSRKGKQVYKGGIANDINKFRNKWHLPRIKIEKKFQSFD